MLCLCCCFETEEEEGGEEDGETAIEDKASDVSAPRRFDFGDNEESDETNAKEVGQ